MRSTILFSIACLTAGAAPPTFAADGPKAASTVPDADADAAYTRVLEKRAGDMLDVLKLDDPAKAARVREAVIAQYRSLRRLHDARDANIKALRERPQSDQAELEKRIKAERERTDAAVVALHQEFLNTLAADLSTTQVDQVKDKLTYNKLQVTYRGYLEMLPDLTPEQKRTVHDQLKEARERAMDGGSSEEKSDIFNKYKGRINNYLTAQGYDLKRASKEWAARRKQAK